MIEKFSVQLTPRETEDAEKLIREEGFSDMSDLIRHALRYYIKHKCVKVELSKDLRDKISESMETTR